MQEEVNLEVNRSVYLIEVWRSHQPSFSFIPVPLNPKINEHRVFNVCLVRLKESVIQKDLRPGSLHLNSSSDIDKLTRDMSSALRIYPACLLKV
jgi:hypothetical protein